MNFVTATNGSAPFVDFGIDLAAKVTALLAVGLLVQQVLARWRATLGAAVSNACLLGLLLVPFSALILPAVKCACLPVATNDPSPRAPALNLPDSDSARRPDLTDAFLVDAPAHDRRVTVAAARVRVTPGERASRLAPAPAVSGQPVPLAVSSPTRRMDWIMLGLAVYAIVAVVLVVRVLTSLRAVARLRDGSPHVTAGAWWQALERGRRRLAIDRAVGLAWSPRVGVPLALGWVRPTIVLPVSLSASDPNGHADAVLLHELSHVRRGDYPWNVLLRIVQAVYWPHPLIWLLGRVMAEVRERACDDLCIHELGGPSAYREALLAVAQGVSRRASPALGLAMARPSAPDMVAFVRLLAALGSATRWSSALRRNLCRNLRLKAKLQQHSPALGVSTGHTRAARTARPSRLGKRLARIDESRGAARCVPSIPARLAIAVTAVAASLALGTVQLTRAEGRGGTLAGPGPAVKADLPAQPQGGSGRVFHLRVVAADSGKPVPDAEVRLWIAFRDEWRKTDAQGRLDIVYSTGPSDLNFGIDVWGEGRAMQRHHWGLDPSKPVPDGETIRLLPGEALGGIVQDEQGRPIGGATVFLWSHNYRNRGSGSHELLYDLRAVSGPDGRWRTSGAPATTGELRGFKVDHPDFLSSRDYFDTEINPKIGDLRAEKAVTVMKKGVPIEGRVVDAAGKPVAGARVLSMDDQRAMYASIRRFEVSTDVNGQFRAGQVKPGNWFVVASAPGHGPGDQQVVVGKAMPQVEIRLGRAHTFKGRVVDPSGNPIVGAFVDPDLWKGAYRCLGADADGRFRWDDAPGDDLIVNVRQQGYVDVFQRHVAPSANDVVFTLEPCLPVSGLVRDAETKERVEKATLEFGAVNPRTGNVTQWKSPPEVGFSTGVLSGVLRVNLPVAADEYKIRIRSPGYQTFISRVFRRDEKAVVSYEVMLQPGTTRPAGAVATLIRADGTPVAGARVYGAPRDKGFTVEDGVVNGHGGNGRADRTGADGTFALPQIDEPWMVLILGDDVFAIANNAELEKTPKIVAQPYGRIEGRCLIGGRPVPNQYLELAGFVLSPSMKNLNVHLQQTTKTYEQGRFTFKNVIPTRSLRVTRRESADRGSRTWSIGEPVRVEPGATAQMTLGGKGRPVIGRVEPPAGWTKPLDFTDRSEARIESNRPLIPYPLSLFRGKTSLAGLDLIAWQQRWRDSGGGDDYADGRVSLGVALATDGSFRIDDVPPGDYRLVIRVNEDFMIHVAVMIRRNPGPFPHTIQFFTVPPVPEGRSDDPIDLGVLRLNSRPALEVGQPAPAFKVVTVEGKTLSVPEDFRGKFLLIDFTTMWDIEAPFQIPRLNEVNQKFAKDGRLTILSLTFAPDTPETRKWIDDKGEGWPQAIVGPLSNPIATAFDIDDTNVSTPILIGPDGKIVAKDLWRTSLAEAVGRALGRADK